MINANYPAHQFIAVTRRMFREAFSLHRDVHPRIAAATSEYVDESNPGGTLFVLTNDKRSGYAIRPNGELVYVFSTVKGRGDAIVDHAVFMGAERLDCYDGYLVTLYGRHGFHESSREPNWTPGGPDVVWMSR